LLDDTKASEALRLPSATARDRRAFITTSTSREPTDWDAQDMARKQKVVLRFRTYYVTAMHSRRKHSRYRDWFEFTTSLHALVYLPHACL